MEQQHHNGAGSADYQPKKSGKQNNVLPYWGNEATMNLNPLILTNIQSSSYFKVHLFKLKTYHEVVDEIYYQVKHLEPWERGSRKTAGQTGMCGGVRGVGAGGIVSTAYCLLYKLYTLRLTRKQLNGLLTHGDSPYIRALGFMYIRYTQPPADLYDWYEEYLLDEEEVAAKACAAGPPPAPMTIGQMLHQFLVKLDWFSTLFPRIPVPIQKQIDARLQEFSRENAVHFAAEPNGGGPSSGNGGPRNGAGRNGASDYRSDRGDYHGQREQPYGRGGGGGDRQRYRSRSRDRRAGSDDRRGGGSSSYDSYRSSGRRDDDRNYRDDNRDDRSRSGSSRYDRDSDRRYR